MGKNKLKKHEIVAGATPQLIEYLDTVEVPLWSDWKDAGIVAACSAAMQLHATSGNGPLQDAVSGLVKASSYLRAKQLATTEPDESAIAEIFATFYIYHRRLTILCGGNR